MAWWTYKLRPVMRGGSGISWWLIVSANIFLCIKVMFATELPLGVTDYSTPHFAFFWKACSSETPEGMCLRIWSLRIVLLITCAMAVFCFISCQQALVCMWGTPTIAIYHWLACGSIFASFHFFFNRKKKRRSETWPACICLFGPPSLLWPSQYLFCLYLSRPLRPQHRPRWRR